jgi:hypothetical protein
MKKLTYKEVLDETVKFYSEDTSRRAKTNNGECRYYISDTQQCAVGRYMKNPKEFEDNSSAISGLIHGEGHKLSELLKEEVNHLDNVLFWMKIQTLHDVDSNFEESKLSVQGEKTVNDLEDYIKQNKLDG